MNQDLVMEENSGSSAVVNNIGDKINVQWDGFDKDGDQLTYCLLISDDNGETWYTHEVDLNRTEFELNTTYFVSGEMYKLKIRISRPMSITMTFS